MRRPRPVRRGSQRHACRRPDDRRDSPPRRAAAQLPVGARYAAVLADDPGSAVLTLTSFGLAQRSRRPGQNPSPVVALWKSPGQNTREIPLDPGTQGILLSASARHAVRRSSDGRRPGHNGSEFFDVTVHQIRASRASIGPPHSPAGSVRRTPVTPSRHGERYPAIWLYSSTRKGCAAIAAVTYARRLKTRRSAPSPRRALSRFRPARNAAGSGRSSRDGRGGRPRRRARGVRPG